MLSYNDTETEKQTTPRQVVVIGAGIAGLAAAYRVMKDAAASGIKVQTIVCESSERIGGTISTYRLEDTILEMGPDSFITDKPAAMNLVEELGITHRLISTDEENRRTFIARQGKLYPLPEGFLMMAPTKMLPFLSSNLFSFSGKLRILQEMSVPAADPSVEESLSQFVERRFGREALDRVIQPLVGGIYTGDPDKLSVKAALPKMAQLEQTYGSVMKGLMSGKHRSSGSGARYGMFASFDSGMLVLINSLEAALPDDSIRLNSLVERIELIEGGKRWEVALEDGSIIAADAVIIATPTQASSRILSVFDQTLSGLLGQIEHSSCAVLNLIFRRQDIKHKLDGFGFVVPRTERKHTLACSFASIKFPRRTNEGLVVLRAFVGGALQQDVFELRDEFLDCLVWEDLNCYLGLKTIPVYTVLSRYENAMPQYNIGHSQLVEKIEQTTALHPGLALAGNAFHGVGIPDCIESGNLAARRVVEHLRTLPVDAR